MIDDEIEIIATQIQEGFFSKKLLYDLINKVTTPFIIKKDGYTTVANAEGASSASVLSLMAVDNVLHDKRKADEISRIEAKRRKLNGKKTRTPNTTRGSDGFTVATNLQVHDNTHDAGELAKRKKNIEKEISQHKGILTNWAALMTKKQAAATKAGVAVEDPSLWVLTPQKTTKIEQQLFLRMCVPESKKLGKKPDKQIECLRNNNVTYLRLLAARETIESKLTSLKKLYEEQFCSKSSVEVDTNSDNETIGSEVDQWDDDDFVEMLENIDDCANDG